MWKVSCKGAGYLVREGGECVSGLMTWQKALWRKVIVGKDGEDRWGLVPMSFPKYHSSGIWSSVSCVGDKFNFWSSFCERVVDYRIV